MLSNDAVSYLNYYSTGDKTLNEWEVLVELWQHLVKNLFPSHSVHYKSLGFKPDIHTEKSVNNHLRQDTIFYHQIYPITAIKMTV
jgi:hypothetical protein